MLPFKPQRLFNDQLYHLDLYFSVAFQSLYVVKQLCEIFTRPPHQSVQLFPDFVILQIDFLPIFDHDDLEKRTVIRIESISIVSYLRLHFRRGVIHDDAQTVRFFQYLRYALFVIVVDGNTRIKIVQRVRSDRV